MSLGLQRGTVKLSEHDSSWKDIFDAEKIELQKIFEDSIIGVEHIGSTSIPGIKAKPILDLMVAIPSLDGWKEYENGLQKLGYQFRTDFRETQGNVLFVKGPEDSRTHYLKLTELGSDFWVEHLLFRDFLISHPESRQEYEDIKTTLLETYKGDRKPYTEGKKAFIEKILKLAGYTGKIL
ncbi:MAG TPA: GrpB family protein [Candidatus Paceibacterota bacterium]|jgi:GrpB-like predicted nucleotidyltransferase (UPF0157 family)|nr:GrpB family protein [Candidatus Paceibacterota bacterium]